MAREKEQSSAPVVTSLPLPSSDNALVIDLPDGQKLLVGKMNHGTVIEIATWRGTGRPDSRTNRLMLGMSNSTEETVAEPATSSQEEIDKRSIRYVIYLMVKGLNSAFNSLKKIDVKNLVPKFKRRTKRKPLTSTPEQSVDEVQAWLDSIKERTQASTKSASSVELHEANLPKKSSISRKATKKSQKSPNKSSKGSSKPVRK